MSTRRGEMRLGLFLPGTGHHLAAWRDPKVDPAANTDIKHYANVARIAERGLFDMLFLADTAGHWGPQDPELSKFTSAASNIDPLTLLAALAMVTEHIGLVATMSTSYNEPYNVARRFASLDLISNGRSGWNLVTSSLPQEAEQYNQQVALSHDERYDRATEFAEVVLGLWDSWDTNAFRRDQKSGIFFDPAKRHELHHKGRFFTSRGPLSVERSPQGRPVLVNAGQSEPGRELAARFAEVIFAVQQDVNDARTYYADVKDRVARLGRNPALAHVLPGVLVIAARTRGEAEDKFAALQSNIPPEVGLAQLAENVGVDLSAYPLDEAVPDLPETNAQKARQRVILDLARREGLTLRQLYQRVAGARAHRVLIGTAEEIAEDFEHWFEAEACDGFNIMPATAPDGLTDFVDLIVPELQRRGRFRKAYSGTTLRDNLGLPIPQPRRHSAAAE